MPVLTALALAAGAYLLGSLPFGVWIGYARTGRDIRAAGSGHSAGGLGRRRSGHGP